MVSADHKFIQMGFEVEETTLQKENVPLFPVTTSITPLFEGGAQGQPVPFTMFLQQPCFITQRVHQEVCVPCGQTALFKTWSRCDKVPEECGLPILSCLPYIGDMFKTVGYHEETADVWIMITPRIVMGQEQEIRPPVAAAPYTVTDNLEKLQQAQALLEQADHCRWMGQTESAVHIYEKVQRLCPGSRYAQMAASSLMRSYPHVEKGDRPQEVLSFVNGHVTRTRVLTSDPEPKVDPKVSEYLTNYWRACAEGRMSEATQWAVQALALDPACFSKVRDARWKKSPQPAVMPSAN